MQHRKYRTIRLHVTVSASLITGKTADQASEKLDSPNLYKRHKVDPATVLGGQASSPARERRRVGWGGKLARVCNFHACECVRGENWHGRGVCGLV